MATVKYSTNLNDGNNAVKDEDPNFCVKKDDQGDDPTISRPNLEDDEVKEKGKYEVDTKNPKPRKPQSDFLDGHDNEFPNHNIHLISLNQEDEKHGHYVKIKSEFKDGEELLVVTADGIAEDQTACWAAHFTLDETYRQIVIFENLGWSHKNPGKCVLCVNKDMQSRHFTLSAKRMDQLPEQLALADNSICFIKKPRSTGSEIVYFESALSVEGKELLMGFNSQGIPLPMDEVKLNSHFYESYFRIMPCRHAF